MSNFWKNFFIKQKVVILLGSGGVGKTSSAIAVSILAASHGLKVGLLSIDPAKRLADALGLTMDGQFQKVELGSEEKGELHTAMLDQKLVFDQMVRKHAPSTQVAEKILRHPLYLTASEHITGAVEYMALAKLAEMIHQFDLVVLDTPPDTHALDFLNRPNILAGFMDNKVLGWLVKPFHLASRLGLQKIFSFGEKLMGGVARVTGLQALSLLSEFLVLIQEVISGFHQSSIDVLKILKKDTTSFILVGLPESHSIATMQAQAKVLRESRFQVECAILNRALPLEKTDLENLFQSGISEDLISPLLNRQESEPSWQDLASTLGSGISVFKVHERTGDLHNLAGMRGLAQALSNSAK